MIKVDEKLKEHWCRFDNLPISSSSYVEEICAHEICEKFVYKHSKTTEYVKN